MIEVKTQVAGAGAGAGAAGMVGNVVAGGIIGMGVDAATGSTLEHVPNPVHAILQKDSPAPRGAANRRR